MRNKAQLNKDTRSFVVQEHLDIDFVQAAAHSMNHKEDLEFVIPGIFTIEGYDHVLKFERIHREGTFDENGVQGRDVDDYLYLGFEVRRDD